WALPSVAGRRYKSGMHASSPRLVVGLAATLFCLCAVRSHGAEKQSLLHEQEFLPATMCESGQSFWDARAIRCEVLADRRVYFADDVDGQFLVAFLGKIQNGDTNTFSLQLELKDVKSGKSIEAKTIAPVKGPKLPVLIPMGELKPGQYELSAMLKSATN